MTEKTEEQPIKLYHYVEQQIISRIHHFYISQTLEAATEYAEMVHIIQTAGPDSVVYLHLNTGGGQLDTGIQIINSLQSSAAHVICSLEGEVASLGTLIFLAADEFVVHDNSVMMMHNYSGWIGGKGHEQIAALEATTKWTKEIMERLYVPFLTPDEVIRIRNGEDLYFHAPDVRKRLTKMVKALEKERKESVSKPRPPKGRKMAG